MGSPLVELSIDLPIQLPHRPAAANRLGLVEFLGASCRDRHQPDVVGPGEREDAGVCRSWNCIRLPNDHGKR